jgi:hypothetical protein
MGLKRFHVLDEKITAWFKQKTDVNTTENKFVVFAMLSLSCIGYVTAFMLIFIDNSIGKGLYMLFGSSISLALGLSLYVEGVKEYKLKELSH